jgi:hypothetical protein
VSVVKPWFRCYTRIRDDDDLNEAPTSTRWAWIVCLCIARENREPGVLMLGDDKPVDARRLSRKANITEAEATAALETFHDARMVVTDDAGRPVIHRWADYQCDSDTSTPRVRAHRERKRNVTGLFPVTNREEKNREEKNARDDAAEKVKCPDCHGTGKTHIDGDPDKPRCFCDTCNGTGEVAA